MGLKRGVLGVTEMIFFLGSLKTRSKQGGREERLGEAIKKDSKEKKKCRPSRTMQG